MLRLPTLLPLKPSTPTTGLNPTRRNHGRYSRRLLASPTPPPPRPPRPPNPTPEPPKPEHRTSRQNPEEAAAAFPTTKPRKPRRGRRSEAAAVEDFVRGRLEQVFASIRERDPEILEGKGDILKRKEDGERISDEEGRGDPGEEEGEQKAVVEEEDPSWPLDADVGWGVRASEYFDKHSIKNVTVDGVEIDWEGEADEGWVKEINCLEWESFAFHPSPLVVLVFERYNRATHNWKFLHELEKAAKVYWNAKDRLPPRTVKIDMNIETDLAYALQVKECPQLLFLRGNKILYREKEIRTADELVQMIAHFYYNAKRPSCVNPDDIAPPF